MKSFKQHIAEVSSMGGANTTTMKGLASAGAVDFATRTGVKASRTSKNKNGPLGFELPTNLNISQTELDKYSGNAYAALSARGAEVLDKKTRKMAIDFNSPIEYDKVTSPDEWNTQANASLNKTLDDMAQKSQSSNKEKMISNWIDGKSGVSSVAKVTLSYKEMISQLKTAVKKIGTDTQRSQGSDDDETRDPYDSSSLDPNDPFGPRRPFPQWPNPNLEPEGPYEPGPTIDPDVDPTLQPPVPAPDLVAPRPGNPTTDPTMPPPTYKEPKKPKPTPRQPPTFKPTHIPFPWWILPFIPFLIPNPLNPALAKVGEDVDHSQKHRKRLRSFKAFL